MTLAQMIARLTRGYIKETGRQPVGLDKLRIKMEAAEKLRQINKVIQFPQQRSFKQEIESMINDGTIKMGGVTKQSDKVRTRNMFKDSNLNKPVQEITEDSGEGFINFVRKTDPEGAAKLQKVEDEIKAAIEAGNKRAIENLKKNKKLDEPEDMADGGVAGLLGERPGYSIGQRVEPNNFMNLGLGNVTQGQNIQVADASIEDLLNKERERKGLKPAEVKETFPRFMADDYGMYKTFTDPKTATQMVIDEYGETTPGLKTVDPLELQQRFEIGIADPNLQQVKLNDEDEYDFSDIEGQTAFVGLPEIFALGKSLVGPAIGLSKSGLSKKAIAEALLKDRLRKEAGKRFKKIITSPKTTTKTPTTKTTTKPTTKKTSTTTTTGGGGGRSYSQPSTAQNRARTASRVSSSGKMRAYGLADGGPARQNFAMGKRAFLKLMGGVGAGIAGLKSGLFGMGGKEATKKAVTETVKSAGSGYPPPYFFKLVDKIKFMGDDVTQKAATQEREVVKRYKDYEMTEDLGTGDIVIKKRNEGSFYDQDGIISDEYIVYKPGQADELTKGKKPPPEYDEYTVRPDADGKLRDSEDGLDSIDEILEEVGDPDSMTLKKASGGIARMLGE
jgi:hypothetical protein